MARIFRKLSKLFSGKWDDSDEDAPNPPTQEEDEASSAGFKTKAEVPVKQEPVIQNGGYSGGGIQGFNWYARAMRVDDEGDVAHQFFIEQPFTAIPVRRPLQWRAVEMPNAGVLEVMRA